ncbi:uncharacterized protein LOC129962846 [Argiope bruennichi]|uniref:uncharacterized protein LOC129962846 n=1 Tax=Argiope bruennichi TaxID=94029 RepID=UPI0024953D82|nr:uncharacterized protein LOC129962846 [Argiope bruennichi]
MRILLNEVRAPTSSQMHKTVDDQERVTFREACEAHGLLENDNHWGATMAKAVLCCSAAKVRYFFTILLSTCELSNPLQLRDKYMDALSEDSENRLNDIHNDLIINETLVLIEGKMISISGKFLSDFGLSIPHRRGEL